MSFSIKDQKCVQVVVFQDRAEVKRAIKTKLKAGESEIIITGLSNHVEEDSIRVEGTGNAKILDVVCQNERVEAKDISNEKAKILLDEIKSLEAEKAKLTDKQARFDVQKSTLKEYASNLAKSKDAEPGNVEKFFGFLDSYTNRLEYIDTEQTTLNNDITSTQEKLDIANDKYNKLMNESYSYNQKKEVKILVESKTDDSEVDLTISYIVYNASWSPKYDIRVFGKDKKMIINYYGMIRQSTGEDWADTKISLSTAMPSVGGNVPELNTENVGIKPKYTSRPVLMKSAMPFAFGGRSKRSSSSDMEFGLFDHANHCEERAQIEPMIAEVEVGEIGSTSTFEIPRIATIPSDTDTHKVSIGIIDLEPALDYESVPRKDSHAFIKAKVINNSQYALLAGPANVFLDNNFVAKTYLKSYSPQEELVCSLGVDPAIRITYKPVKKYNTQTGMLSKYSHTTYEQVIEVKNTTQRLANILVKESIPLSNNEKIQVKVAEPVTKNNPKYVLNKQNILECNLTLAAGKSEDILIKYTIEHPSDCDIEFFQ